MNKFMYIIFAALSISGCQTFNQTLGLERNTPDEYETLDLPPLTLPPNYTELPQPLSARDSRARERAKRALIGNSSAATQSKSHKYLLKKFKTEKNDPKIRSKLNKEHDKFVKENTSILTHYIPYQRNEDVLDAEAEKKRLEKLEKKVADLEKEELKND